MAGVDVMMASRRGGTGLDYYTLTYDDLDEQYEEDSIPGMGSGGSGSPSALAYGFSGHKLPPGKTHSSLIITEIHWKYNEYLMIGLFCTRNSSARHAGSEGCETGRDQGGGGRRGRASQRKEKETRRRRKEEVTRTFGRRKTGKQNSLVQTKLKMIKT